MELIYELIKHGDRKFGLLREHIKVAEVNTEAVAAIFHLNEQYRGGVSTGAGLNEPLTQHLLNLTIDFILEFGWITVWPNKNRLCS